MIEIDEESLFRRLVPSVDRTEEERAFLWELHGVDKLVAKFDALLKRYVDAERELQLVEPRWRLRGD